MKKKIIFLILCTVFVSFFSIYATVAFLTDSDEISNVYTIGKVSITLNETDVDELGVPIDGADRVQDNQYHLMPGYTYFKDPVITVNAGSDNSYIRMLVTINKIDELNKMFQDGFLPEKMVNGWDNQKWLYKGYIDNKDNSYTYEFRYYNIVNGYDGDEKKNKKLEPLFTSFVVADELTGEQLAKLDDLNITIVGQAIQNAGFNNSDVAWTAFDLQYNK